VVRRRNHCGTTGCAALCCAVLCADHGEDKIIMTDYTLLPTILKIAPQLPRLKAVIVLTDRCFWPAGCNSSKSMFTVSCASFN
jgi:hypothetical protein